MQNDTGVLCKMWYNEFTDEREVLAMILVDHDIRAFLANAAANEADQTTIYHGDESCITGIGYDLRTSRVYQNGKAVSEYPLNPGESVFVESEEVIQFDAQTIGRVFLKNSRIRMGLMLDAPVYQPGHKTKIYFRLTNVSNDVLKIEQGAKYAMLMFEQLDKAPAEQYNGTYQAEFDFKGLGDYKSAYLEQIQSIEGKVKNIQDMEKGIYGNVITILTIFVTIFTILNMNIELAKTAASVHVFLNFNLAILGGVSFLALFLAELIGKEKKRSRWLWVIPVLCFAAMILLNLCT